MSDRSDEGGAWPGDRLTLLADAGVLGWAIPAEFGGGNLTAEAMTRGYEELAAACLETAFVLTQRNGACQRLAGSANEALKTELLPKLCRGTIFATVGISHLTTSRQHLAQPSVEVRQRTAGFVFDGQVPWVTGAGKADYIVSGGTCTDGRQLLAAIPTQLSGVEVQPPPRLLALNGSQTASVALHRVEVPAHYIIAGPADQVMKSGKGGGAGSLTTSALALGAAADVLKRLDEEAAKRPEVREVHAALASERQTISNDMHGLLTGEISERASAHGAESIRKRANSLVLRTSQAYLAASKGAGYVQGHPAERAVREAMFFLVWSCPQPVLTAALRELACAFDG